MFSGVEGATHFVELIDDVIPFLLEQLTGLLCNQFTTLLRFLFGEHLDFLETPLEFIFNDCERCEELFALVCD